MRRFLSVLTVLVVTGVASGCSGSREVSGVVADTYYKPSTATQGAIWTAAIEQADGTIATLTTASDEHELAVKVRVGDCVSATVRGSSNVGNSDNVQVTRGDNCQ